MADERITTVESDNPKTGSSTHTTIVREEPARGGSATWIIGALILLALVLGIYLLSQTSASEIAKDNAIAEAANEVGEAAGSVGEAANEVSGAVKDASDAITE